MGIYLNPGTIEFQESINSEIYVDKTMLIERTNAALRTKQKNNSRGICFWQELIMIKKHSCLVEKVEYNLK